MAVNTIRIEAPPAAVFAVLADLPPRCAGEAWITASSRPAATT
jgi:hypothetical protein